MMKIAKHRKNSSLYFHKGVMMVLILMMFVFASCVNDNKQTAWPIEKEANAARFAAPGQGATPEGWQQYANELSISCVLPGDQLLAGGVDGLYRFDIMDGIYRPVLRNGKSYSMVRSLVRDKNGNVWIGHEFGIDSILTGSEEPTMQLDEWNGKPLGQVYDIIEARDGAIWIGTMQGAFRIAGSNIKHYTTANGLIHNMVNVILEDSRDGMWFGAYIANGGGLSCLQLNKDTHEVIKKWTFDHSNGLPEDYITTIMEDSNQSVWAGMGVYTAGGAVMFTFNGLDWVANEPMLLEDGLAGEKVRYIMEDEKGYRWFCSEYDGIAIFDSDFQRVGVLSVDEGLTDNEVKEIKTDIDGNIWMAARKGVVYIPKTWLVHVLWK